MIIASYLVCLLGWIPAASSGETLFSSKSIISKLKLNESRSWKSRVYTQFEGVPLTEISATYLGVPDDATNGRTTARIASNTVPMALFSNISFDWRNSTLSPCVGSIQDQGKCGSCWAVSSVETLADRRCIRASVNSSVPAPRIAFSSLDLIACDKLCDGLVKCCRGCTGGYPKLAFEFIQRTGVVSAECMPYNLSKSLLCPLPKCRKPIDDYAFKAKDVKQILGGVPAMQKEIITYGPVTATFTVFEDFMTYSSGIYKYSQGKRVGLHAVKVVGFGVSGGNVYWKCQNSWGSDWGMNGSFNIASGECGFEESVFVATPCLEEKEECI
eukprot:UC4_evm1s1343